MTGRESEGAPLEIRLLADAPEGWRDLLTRHPRATFFHRSEWVDTYATHHGGRALYLAAFGDEGLEGALPIVRFARNGFHLYESLPLGTYGGPIATGPGDGRVIEAALLDRLLALGNHPLCVGVHCAVRHRVPHLERARFSAKPLHIIPLGDSFQSFWMNILPRNRRNECTRAMKRGVRVDVGATHEDIEHYYPLDVEAHSRWRLRPHPISFFHAIVELESADAPVFVVRTDDRFLGLHVCFVSGTELVVWHGVTSREGSNRFFPTSMLARAEAAFALERGLIALNMGASSGRYGVANYKRLLGGELTESAAMERNRPLLAVARRLLRR